MQEQIPSAFCSGGCEKYENDRRSSLLSAKMRKTSENVRKILRVAEQNVLRSSGDNQRRIRIDTGKEVHGIVGTSVTLEEKSRRDHQSRFTMQ